MSKADELKQKLEKQAEKNCVLNDRIHIDCFVSGYLKGALPRERQIAKLEEICKDLSNKFDYQVKQVMELEKKGSDLLKELLERNKAYMGLLSKTKFLVKDLLLVLDGKGGIDFKNEVLQNAEQFLKE